MLVSSPYTIEQVKSINVYQRTAEMFSPITCKCGGAYYAKEEGLTCKKCLHEIDQVPLFIANGTWNIFRPKPDPEEDE